MKVGKNTVERKDEGWEVEKCWAKTLMKYQVNFPTV